MSYYFLDESLFKDSYYACKCSKCLVDINPIVPATWGNFECKF